MAPSSFPPSSYTSRGVGDALTSRDPRARRVMILVLGVLIAVANVLAIGATVPSASAEQTYAGDDGLTVTVDKDWVTQGDAAGFVVTVTDANTSGVDFDAYKLSGIPSGWQVTVDGAALTPVSPDPVIFELPKSATSFGVIAPAD